MEDPAAMSAADPTKSYALREITRNHTLRALTCQRPRQDATKCYARTPKYAPWPPHRLPRVRRALLKIFEPVERGGTDDKAG
jgi:hypothetical protein